ncbi:MAG: hypothetical protein EPN82_16330 [Bacteroidetes bacterium]|nr:MAG: hypothetical protein EPN82_16330 [Bacteroidota bacterium]
MDSSGIYNSSIRRFTDEGVDVILKSAEKLIEPETIEEITLLRAQPFSAENFLETKESILSGNIDFDNTDYTSTSDILLFYQVKTSEGKYYAIAHRDPFELYFNEAIIWYNQLTGKIEGKNGNQVLYTRNNKHE